MLAKTPSVLPTNFGEVSIAYWQDEEFYAGLFLFQGISRLTFGRRDCSDTPLTWETIQRLKSECGFGGVDAVEVYPRDCDVVNTGNTRHLYLMPQPLHFAMRSQPFSFFAGASNGVS